MMNGAEIVSIVDQWAGVAVTLGIGGAWLAKRLPAIKKVEPLIAEGIDAAESALGRVLHSPALEGVKLEAAHLKSQVEDSNVFKAVTAVLHNVDTKIEEMAPETKTAVALAVSTQVDKLFGHTVTVNQVLSVMDEFVKLTKDVAGEPSVKAAKQLAEPQPVASAQ